ncbi:MAG: hypothetical protein SGI88_15460 [Candidatus Hydrogenedentes bacterium]|nr:hypothetical protein [Candidatus Hydrogenedentota bacterium]
MEQDGEGSILVTPPGTSVAMPGNWTIVNGSNVQLHCTNQANQHKDAFSHEKSKAILLEGRGTHFQPEIVDAFVQNEKDFIGIQQRNHVAAAPGLFNNRAIATP